MFVPLDVRRLLHHRDGLKCIPACFKRFALSELQKRDGGWEVEAYKHENLRLISEYIEPLISPVDGIGNPAFRRQCRATVHFQDAEEMAAHLGKIIPPQFGMLDIWDWAVKYERGQPEVSLQLAAIFLVSPTLMSERSPETNSLVSTLIATNLSCLGTADAANQLILEAMHGQETPSDGWKNIRRTSIASQTFVLSRFGFISASTESLNADNALSMINSWWQECGRDAALQFGKEKLLLVMMLQLRNEPHLSCVDVRLLELCFGIEARTYQSEEELISYLGMLDKAEVPRELQCTTVRRMADAFGGIPARPNSASRTFIDAWLGIRTTDYVDRTKLCSKLLSAIEGVGLEEQSFLLQTIADSYFDSDEDEHAVALFECWLGIDKDTWESPERLAIAFADTGLHKLPPGQQALLVQGFAKSVLFTPSLSHCAVVPFLAWLTCGTDWNEEVVHQLLVRSTLSKVQMATQCHVITTFMACLRMDPSYGTKAAVILGERWIGIDRQELVADSLQCSWRLGEAGIPEQCSIIRETAICMMQLDDRGVRTAFELITAWLEIYPEAHFELDIMEVTNDDTDRLAHSKLHECTQRERTDFRLVFATVLYQIRRPTHAYSVLRPAILGNDRMADMDPDRECQLYGIFINICQQLFGADAAIHVIGRWLDLSDDWASMDTDLFSHAFEAKQLHILNGDNRMVLCEAVSVAIAGLGEKWQTVAISLMLEAIGAGQVDLSMPDACHAAMAGLEKPRLTNQIHVIGKLIPFMLESPEFSDLEARNVLLGWLGQPFLNALNSSKLQNVVPSHVVSIGTLLTMVAHGADECLGLGTSLASFIRTVRDVELEDDNHREEFIRKCEAAWTAQVSTFTEQAANTRAQGLVAEADHLEREFLLFGEDFENRLVYERALRLESSSCVMAEDVSVRGIASIVNGRRACEFVDGVLTPFFGGPMSLGISDREWPMGAASGAQDISRQTGSRSHLRFRDSCRLADLIPKGSLWLRALFDAKGRLHWWLLDANKIMIQARGEPFGESRIRWAMLLHDLQIENVWATWMHGALTDTLSDDELVVLWHMADQLDRTQDSPDAFLDGTSFPKTELALLDRIENSRPQFASLGRTLLLQAHDQEMGSGWASLIETMSQTISSESLLRELLDTFTDQLLDVLNNEFGRTSLDLLFSTLYSYGHVDLLVEAGGPLWGAPIEWLEVSGTPLFRVVDSVTQVFSLALRSTINSIVGRTEEEPLQRNRNVLSVSFLSPEEWIQSRGLFDLVQAVENISQQSGWEHYSLAEAPIASRINLAAAIQRTDAPISIAVVAGHGAKSSPGVMLFDGIWMGEGADAAKLELMIFVACALGRIEKRQVIDADGFYARLLIAGAPSAIAAKWPISDREAATLTAEVFYQCANASEDAPKRFRYARALNKARIQLVDHPSKETAVSRHLMSAFAFFS